MLALHNYTFLQNCYISEIHLHLDTVRGLFIHVALDTAGYSCGGGGGQPFSDYTFWRNNGDITAIEMWHGGAIDGIKVSTHISTHISYH